MSHLLAKIEQMARNQTEVERVRAIAKAAATVLSKSGYPTQIVFGKPTKGKKKLKGPPRAQGPQRVSGAPTQGQKRGKKVRRKQDGTPYVEGEYVESDIDFQDIDFSDVDNIGLDESELDEGGEFEADANLVR